MCDSAQESLERLQVDCVDLLLLHWPNDDVPLDATLGALAELREEGLIKHFGVSNFPAGMLRDALGSRRSSPTRSSSTPSSARTRSSSWRRSATSCSPPTPRSPAARCRGRGAARDRRRPRQERRPGRAALAARQAQRLRDPEGLEPRAAGRELRGLRLRAQRRRAGEDRRAAQGRARDRPGLGARLGRLTAGSCPGVAGRPLGRTVRVEQGPELGEHEARVLEDVAVGVAAELVTARPRLTLSPPILLPASGASGGTGSRRARPSADVRASGNRRGARRRAGWSPAAAAPPP